MSDRQKLLQIIDGQEQVVNFQLQLLKGGSLGTRSGSPDETVGAWKAILAGIHEVRDLVNRIEPEFARAGLTYADSPFP